MKSYKKSANAGWKMRKISFWINTGFAGCDYQETMEFDDSITDEQLDEEAKIFLPILPYFSLVILHLIIL